MGCRPGPGLVFLLPFLFPFVKSSFPTLMMIAARVYLLHELLYLAAIVLQLRRRLRTELGQVLCTHPVAV